jgi:hypothetical protein
MSATKAHVVNGQVVLDEPAELPEGAALVVYVRDEDEDEESTRRSTRAWTTSRQVASSTKQR